LDKAFSVVQKCHDIFKKCQTRGLFKKKFLKDYYYRGFIVNICLNPYELISAT